MKLDPWLLVDGVEVVNPWRLSAYVAAGLPHRSWALDTSCRNCASPTITYLTPAADLAPWYDVTVPASSEFFGATSFTLIRTVDPASWVTTLTGTLDIISSTRRGAEFGRQWVTQQLSGCNGLGLSRQVCNASTVEVMLDCANPGPSLRTIANARLVGLPEIIDSTIPCEAGIRLGFTMTSESPWLWGAVHETVLTNPWGAVSLTNAQCDPALAAASAPPPDFALFPPYCAPAALPTLVLPPLSACECEPILVAMACATTTPPVPGYVAGGLVITINNGPADLKGLRITAWPNPSQQPCPNDVSVYDYWAVQEPLAIATIPWLPAGALLTIDGRSETTGLRIHGIDQPGEQLLYGALGGLWNYPAINCDAGDQICVCVAIDAIDHCGTTPACTISVGIAERHA